MALQYVRAAAEERSAGPIRQAARELVEIEEKAARLVPQRLVTGPLTLEPLAQRVEGPFRWPPFWSAPHNDQLIWADGERSVLEIWRCARQAAGEDGVDLEEIVAYFEFLAAHGYVAWGAAHGESKE